MLFCSVSKFVFSPQNSLLLSLAQGGHGLMSASIADSSIASYSVGWRKWTSFASLVGISSVPPVVDNGVMIGDLRVPSMVALTFAFCQYHFKELRLTPATVCGYLSGVSFNLKLRLFDVGFITSPNFPRRLRWSEPE